MISFEALVRWGVLCGLPVVFVTLASGAAPDTKGKTPPKQELKHDDGKSAGMRSIAGSGHAVRFESPGENAHLRSIKLYGSRYGYPQAPKEDFHVWLCDEDLKVLETFDFPYATFKRGEPKWVTLDVAPTKLPAKFVICVGFNPEQTKGVYVHHDAKPSGDSLVGLPDKEAREFDKGDWMIRAVITERPETARTSRAGRSEALKLASPPTDLIDDTDALREQQKKPSEN